MFFSSMIYIKTFVSLLTTKVIQCREKITNLRFCLVNDQAKWKRPTRCDPQDGPNCLPLNDALKRHFRKIDSKMQSKRYYLFYKTKHSGLNPDIEPG